MQEVNQTHQPAEGQSANVYRNLADIALEISAASDSLVGNQPSQSNEEQSNSTSRPSNQQQTANAPNSPFQAINLFLEQNPEMYAVLQTFLAYIPFLILILFKEIYKHTSGNLKFLPFF